MPIREGCYGYKKGIGGVDPVDAVKFGSLFPMQKKLPSSVDLVRPEWISPCYDQLQTSSCVLNMWAAIVEYGQRRSGGPTWTPSRLFAYFNVREMEGTVNRDSGSYCHDAFHQARFVGVIPEDRYPFSDNIAIITARPPKSCYIEAVNIRPKNFAYLDNTVLDELKSCLAHGFPFGGGFQVPAIFQTAAFEKNPILTLPGPLTRFVGGHGTAYFGYDDNKETADGMGAFKVRNSWGEWGEDGYFWMSYKFATSHLLSDVLMCRFPNQQTSLE